MTLNISTINLVAGFEKIGHQNRNVQFLITRNPVTMLRLMFIQEIIQNAGKEMIYQYTIVTVLSTTVR